MKRTTKIIMFVAGLGALYLFTKKRAPAVPQQQPGQRQIAPGQGSTRYDRDIEVIRSIRDAVNNTVEQIPWPPASWGQAPTWNTENPVRAFSGVSGAPAPPAPPPPAPAPAPMNGNGMGHAPMNGNGNGLNGHGGAVGQSRGRAPRGMAGMPKKNRYSG